MESVRFSARNTPNAAEHTRYQVFCKLVLQLPDN